METKAYTGHNFYDSYSEYVEDNPLYQVEYRVFRDIIKHKPKEYTGKSLRIDYAESKKYGKVIYHLNEITNGFKYRYYWNKKNMITKNKTKYQLIMTRDNKRRLAYILKNRIRDYVEL